MHYVTKNHFDNFDDDNGTESEVMVISAQMQLTQLCYVVAWSIDYDSWGSGLTTLSTRKSFLKILLF